MNSLAKHLSTPLSYQCPKFGENFNVYTSLNNYPVSQNVLPVNGDVPLFPHCEIPSYYSPDISDFSDCELIIWDDLQLDKDESWKLEGETREQADCDIWIQERKKQGNSFKNLWSLELEKRV